MQSDGTHLKHRRRAFLAVSCASLGVMVLFSIVQYVEAAPWGAGITIGMAVLTAGSIRAMFTGSREQTVYRFFCSVAGIGLFGVATVGHEVHLYFHLALPLGLFFFLGNREGTIWSLGNLAALLFLLLAMEIPDSLVRETGNILRFAACYLLISVIAWSYEKLQEEFYGALDTTSRQLQREKDQLAASLKRTEETESQLAEITDTILHNIGNAVTSAAEGARTLDEQLAGNELVSRLEALGKSLEAHRGDWIPYLQNDPQGRKVLPFILALAHDFSRQNDRLHGTASRVRDRVEHIADIVRTERSFESGRAMTRKDIDLRKAVTDAVGLLREPLGKRGIRVQTDCRGAPKEIRIQESRFHQLLVNLTKNGMEAIDALVEAGGLKGEPRIRIRAFVRDGFLVLEVTDNGVGVEADNPRILFAAGYSTKQDGSGLGLHSAANFVVGSGGRIHVLSDGFGKGATVRVELRLSPVLPRSESGTPPADAESPAASRKHRARPRNAPVRPRS